MTLDDDAAAGAAARPDAARGAGRHRHLLFARADQAGRVPQHPRDTPHRIHLGGRRGPRRHADRHAARAFSSRSSCRCVALAQQTANPPVHVLGRKPGTNVFRPRSPAHPEDETYPGLLLLRLEGRVFFLNAERIAEKTALAVRRVVREGRGARPQRRVRSRIFRAQDADRSGKAPAREQASHSGSPR